ncbi:MAG: SPFH domain-containing protein [Candidatus Bathyarchaeia archaeon]
MPQVIEWVNPSGEDVVWRYPIEDITWGAQLIVHEMETAVFFRDGKVYEVFGPGRHTLTTQNLPLLTGVLSRIAGFERNPFKCMVIYVSMRRFAGKFGGRTQTVEIAPLMFHGSYWFQIRDPSLFVMEVVGRQSLFTTTDVNEYIRGYINEATLKQLSTYSIFNVFTNLPTVSSEVKVRIAEEFTRFGMELTDLRFEGVDTAPEWRDRIFYIRGTGVAPSEVLRMETVKETAKELGKSPGAAVGAGVVLVPPLLYAPPHAAQPMVPCPKCGASMPQGSKFCSNCGSPLTGQPLASQGIQTKNCPNCNQAVPAESKFCLHCGFKFP